jgi:hypothetical protein
MPADRTAPLERRILLTVLYAELFRFPLSEEELRRRLIGPVPEEGELRGALAALLGRELGTRDGFLFWAGREDLVEVRRERARLSDARWPRALRYGRWLRWIPFLRLAAVSGSLAVHNGGPGGDVDFFLVTEARRLWIARTGAVLLARLTRPFAARLCPNHVYSSPDLEASPRDLYRAHEVVQVLPLWGRETYERFLAGNAWTRAFLGAGPGPDRRGRLAEAPRPLATRAVERLLAGRLGDLLDRGLYRLHQLYLRAHLPRRGWRLEELRAAYRRDRQTALGGGHAGAVRRAFTALARRRLGDDVPELEDLFPGEAARARPAPALALDAAARLPE